jgi:zinc transporter ZupT
MAVIDSSRDKSPHPIPCQLLLSFADSLVAWLASTGISALSGLIVAVAVNRYLKQSYLLAFSLGILFWVFIDVINDSGDLDVNASFSGGWEQTTIVVLFAASLSVFFLLDRSISPTEPVKNDSLAIPILIAMAIGIHGMGEGAAFANVSATTSTNSLVIAFGGESAGAAYVLHKLLEAIAVGVGYLVFAGRLNVGFEGRVRDICLLSLAFVIPSVVAEGAGYFVAYDSTYFYAIGTGGFLYALLKLVGPLSTTHRPEGRNGSLKMAAWLLAGFLCVYVAALLHSYLPSSL